MTEKQTRRLAIVGFGLWLVAHVFWIFRTEINWDEFALLARAHDSLEQGQLLGGGRPGLSTLLLMPIVDGCSDALKSVHTARLLWTPFVAGILVGLWFTLRGLFVKRESACRDAFIGVALMALTPAFLRYSLQVRTDQPAVALGLLAAALLLASRRRPSLAALAGVLLAAGYASSQKVLYVAALAGCLVALDTFLHREWHWRRDLVRIGMVVAACLTTLLMLRVATAVFIVPAAPLDLSDQMEMFASYRTAFGYSYYLTMLPDLVVPLTLLLVVVVYACRALLKLPEKRHHALLVLTVVVLGLAVAGFHAGAFPYFWMTLGLFPAVAIATGLPLLRGHLSEQSFRRGFVFLATLFLATAVSAGVRLSRDGQAVQRETLRFVDENFPASAEGFHDTRALFCRDGVDPFPTYFSHVMHSRFDESDGRPRVGEFIEEFRRRPVVFIVETFRLTQFPIGVQEFWNDHYVRYAEGVLVPGLELESERERRFQVIVPGDYVLHSDDSDSAVQIDGTTLEPGKLRRLEVGSYDVRQVGGEGSVLLALALPSRPGPTTEKFYMRF